MSAVDATRNDVQSSESAGSQGGVIRGLFSPVDSASLAVFRILFGLVMAWEAYRYLASGWVRSFFVKPQTHFTYYGFSWAKPWDGALQIGEWKVEWMIVHYIVFLLASWGVALGFLYRFSAVVLWVSFTYTYLLDQALYLNHLYLASLISFLLIFMPAHRMLSIDALLWRSKRSDWIPAWPVWTLRAYVGLIYSFAGVAKLNSDWVFHCEPVRMWLQGRSERTIFDGFLPIGRLFELEPTIWFIAYGGLTFDLLIAFFLFWRRTRAIAFLFALFFHLTNFYLFSIGIFPWMMIGATLIFFDPDWPRRVLNLPRRQASPPLIRPGSLRRVAVVGGIAIWFAVQILMPLRHFVYPGDVHWTEEGHRFAWHMKLRSKSGKAYFTVSNPETGFKKEIRLKDHLTDRQIRKMATHPDMILQFAHYVAEIYREKGHGDVEVHARVMVGLNGRPRQLYIDPERDLAKIERSLLPSDWILAIDDSIPPGRNRLSSAPADASGDEGGTFSVTPEEGERPTAPSASPGDDE